MYATSRLNSNAPGLSGIVIHSNNAVKPGRTAWSSKATEGELSVHRNTPAIASATEDHNNVDYQVNKFLSLLLLVHHLIPHILIDYFLQLLCFLFQKADLISQSQVEKELNKNEATTPGKRGRRRRRRTVIKKRSSNKRKTATPRKTKKRLAPKRNSSKKTSNNRRRRR